MFVMKLGHYPVVLGIPWLRLYDVAVQFSSNMVTFRSHYCTTHCHDAPVMVQGVTEEPPEPVFPQEEGIFVPQIHPQRPFQGSIVMPIGYWFFRTVKLRKIKVLKASLYDINRAIGAKHHKKWPLEEVVLKQYHEFLPLFNKVLADRLPPHWPGINHEVCLKERETPTWGPIYSMSTAKLVVFKEWLKEYMSKGFIRQLLSPFAPPALVAKKPDGWLRFCIHFWHINYKTITNRYPHPWIRETLNLLRKAEVYMTLEVRGAYNVFRIQEGDEH